MSYGSVFKDISRKAKKRGNLKMPSTWVLTVYGQLMGALPYGMADEWEATLKSMRDAIKHALLTTKIPNEAAYLDKLADASSDRFEAFLNTVGADWNVNDIELKQRVKLARKYNDWKTGVTNAFAIGGQFETQVTAKKGKTEAIRYPLSFVGNKSEDRWRCGSLIALALGGDTRIVRYITSPDTLAGTIAAALKSPYNIYDRPFVVASTVKYGTLLQYADEVGLDKTTLLAALNAIYDEIEGHKVSGSTLTLTATWDATYDCLKVVTDYTAP